MKIVIFGAGALGRTMRHQISPPDQLIKFVDNLSTLWGTHIDGVPVESPACLKLLPFDKIIIASQGGLTSTEDNIYDQLLALGVPERKIDATFVRCTIMARENWLKHFAVKIQAANIEGHAAEAGVFRGDFARVINECFPDRFLYLYDTFSSFPERHLAEEEGDSEVARVLKGYFGSNTSVERVLAQMPQAEKCRVFEGIFPDTADGLDEKFCFVNLDMDLYVPTLAGLKIFYPLLAPGGAILVHDYYNREYPGVAKAVDEFSGDHGLANSLYPIGDGISIMLTKV